jgi:hypothetical protein
MIRILAALMLFAGPAASQGLNFGQGGLGIAGDATIAAGGVAQTIFGGTRPVHGWSVGNPNATDDLWCSDSATAAVNGLGSYRIAANGGLYETPDFYFPSGTVSCIGPTTGDKITARRW